ncbi:unnamed protein product [Diatraea saccharalis]|uniref:Uncharacterized protein n=1 Tax=Diatraea saccharalis TaxID=40085 RepID=A0A9N9QU14_9NEOP|nr:unnamed protein product [Diatraea saccharalis]
MFQFGVCVVKVWLQWAEGKPRALRGASAAPVWAALAQAMTELAPQQDVSHVPAHAVETAPLPEDEELHGFLPIEHALEQLRFSNHAAWDTYGGQLPSPPTGEYQSVSFTIITPYNSYELT